MKKKSAYTLMELLFSIALLSVVVLATYHLFSSALNTKKTITEVMGHKDLIERTLDKLLVQEKFSDVQDILGVGGYYAAEKTFTGEDTGFELLKDNQTLKLDIGLNASASGFYVSYGIPSKPDTYDIEIHVFKIKQNEPEYMEVDGNKIYVYTPSRLAVRFNVGDHWIHFSNNKGVILGSYRLDKDPIVALITAEGHYVPSPNDDVVVSNWLLGRYVYLYTDTEEYQNWLRTLGGSSQNEILINPILYTQQFYQYRVDAQLKENNRLIDEWTTYHFWR